MICAAIQPQSLVATPILRCLAAVRLDAADPRRIMKNSRNDPIRRRRSPLSTLLILIVVLLLGLLALGWWKGGGATRHQVEIPIPADQLGH
jgi:hypothetical protein